MRAILAGAALLGLLSACKVAPTAIVVAIDSDYAVPGELSGLFVNLTKNGRAQPVVSLSLTGAAPYRLPLSFAVAPEGDNAGELSVEVEAHDAGGRLLVRSRRVTRFRPNQTLVLPIVLVKRCAEASCNASETCTEAGCRSAAVDPSSLAAAVPGHEFDGIIVPDAGPPGPDANETDTGLPRPDAGSEGPDAGAADAESADSGAAPDALPPDALPPDALPPDALPPDAIAPDAEPADLGMSPNDAGFPDTGSPDLGFPDTGAPDAGVSDSACPPPQPPAAVSQIGEVALQHPVDLPLLVADLDNNGQDEFVAASSTGEFSIIRFDSCGVAQVARYVPNQGPFVDGPVFIENGGAPTVAFVQDDRIITVNVSDLSVQPVPGVIRLRPDGGLGVDGGELAGLVTLQASPVSPHEILVHTALPMDALINNRTGAMSLFTMSPLPPVTTRPPYLARDSHGSAFAQLDATGQITAGSMDGTFRVVSPFMRPPALATQPFSFSFTGGSDVLLFLGEQVASSDDLAGYQLPLPLTNMAALQFSNFPYPAVSSSHFGGEPTVSVNALSNRFHFYQTSTDGNLNAFDCPAAGGPGCITRPTMPGVNPAIPIITVHFQNEPIPVAIAGAGTELRAHFGTYFAPYGLLPAALSAGPAYTTNYWPRYGAVGALLALPVLGRRIVLYAWTLEQQSGPPDPSTVWPQFRHDARRSGHAQY